MFVSVGCKFCFFFFQAEDGIRVGHVTGVQTCALPICILNARTKHNRRRCGAKAPRKPLPGVQVTCLKPSCLPRIYTKKSDPAFPQSNGQYEPQTHKPPSGRSGKPTARIKRITINPRKL